MSTTEQPLLDVKRPVCSTMSQTSDQTLRTAIRSRQVDRVRALLADGAEPSTTDDRGSTPLMVAATVGSPEIVELLLAAGADPTSKDSLGYTAQDLASWHGEHRMGAYTPESLRIVEMLKRSTATCLRQHSLLAADEKRMTQPTGQCPGACPWNPFMTSRSALRIFIGLFWVLALLSSVPELVSSNWPPPLLQAWTTAEESRTIPPALIVALVTLAIASVGSSIGLLFLRRWAAPIFAATTFLSYVALALLGPHVVHGAGYALGGMSEVCAGIVISLCFWSDALKGKQV